ncbi:hypothetical protein PtA15_3A292 [Puccinia triticina]|uniref:Uncharacterized protein n=1 Tax=Puccinia triticina TaxID=208348 RepID=A0ABY7CEL9_9BASI|nr:uncharacterized protein PtA15_3A292 [Puccinia triticina]WAQ82927.1 hypothetical protein PtA15_3A292 [Puccinia triticina]WAR53751.1 hypothetical protein PtB15_3B260 [Puccinia triticina]
MDSRDNWHDRLGSAVGTRSSGILGTARDGRERLLWSIVELGNDELRYLIA